MKRAMCLAAGLLLAMLGSSVSAQEFPVTGQDASGPPGGRVALVLVYDYEAVYGNAFNLVAEDLQFAYESAGINFAHDVSTIGPVGGPAQPLPDYVNSLRAYASLPGNNGSVLENIGQSFYALSFQVATSQVRSGKVQLNLAFDILPSTMPGQKYHVNFAGPNIVNVLADNNAEYTYPSALDHLTITVVPEPQIALMMLPGIALVGLYTRRRARRNR